MARLLVPVLLLVIGLSASPATAATKQVEVPATLEFKHGPRPTDPGNCSALVFAQWKDTGQKALSATAAVTFANGQTRSETAEGPLFHDTTEFIRVYTVAPGSHWIVVGKGWSDGPRPNDCSETHQKQIAAWADAKAVVRLTVEPDPKVCKAATANVKARNKTVSRLKAKLKAAPAAKKAALRKSLKTAQERLAKAKAQQREAC